MLTWQLVDRLLVGRDGVDEVDVGDSSALDGARELRLDEAAHRHHAGADRLHLGVELLVGVIAHRGSLAVLGAAAISRSGPVM